MLSEKKTGKRRHKIITRRKWFGTETFLVLQEEISYLDPNMYECTRKTCWRNVASLDCGTNNDMP